MYQVLFQRQLQCIVRQIEHLEARIEALERAKDTNPVGLLPSCYHGPTKLISGD